MPSGFTEFLDYTGPVTKDTTVTRSGVKWKQWSPVDAVDKINTKIVLPAFQWLAHNQITGKARRVAQFNYSASNDFTIVDWNRSLLVGLTTWAPVIRYRVGTAGIRYKFDPQLQVKDTFLGMINYTGQVIKKEFCIEIWSNTKQIFIDTDIINPSDIFFTTSLLTSPAINNNPLIEPINGLFSDIYHNVDTPLPIQWNPTGYWNSN